VFDRLDHPSPLGADPATHGSSFEPLEGATPLLALPAPPSPEHGAEQSEQRRRHKQGQQLEQQQQQQQQQQQRQRQEGAEGEGEAGVQGNVQRPSMADAGPDSASPEHGASNADTAGMLGTAAAAGAAAGAALGPLSPLAATLDADSHTSYLDDLLWLLDEPPLHPEEPAPRKHTQHTGRAKPAAAEAAADSAAEVEARDNGDGMPWSPMGARHADLGLWAALEELWDDPLACSEDAEHAAAGPMAVARGPSQPQSAGSGVGAPKLNDQAGREAPRAMEPDAPVGEGPAADGQSVGGPALAAGGHLQADAGGAAAAGSAPGAPVSPKGDREASHHADDECDHDWLFTPDAPEEGPSKEAGPGVATARQLEAAATAGVIYSLHCLYHTQHMAPKAAIYAPLPLLQLLAERAAALVPAGAADAVAAMRALLRSGALVPGAARRPAPRLVLRPGEGTGGGGGKRGGAGDSGPGAVAPGVQREALFHIKAALKGLANFRRLQLLCDSYARARGAVFGPLGVRLAADGNAIRQQQQPGQGQGLQRQQPSAAALMLPSWAAGGSGQALRQAWEQAAAGAGGSRGAEPHDTNTQRLALQRLRLARREQPPTELFEGAFGEGLQQLALTEASALLGALRPRHAREPRPAKRPRLLGGVEGGPQLLEGPSGSAAPSSTRVLTGMAARLYSTPRAPSQAALQSSSLAAPAAGTIAGSRAASAGGAAVQGTRGALRLASGQGVEGRRERRQGAASSDGAAEALAPPRRLLRHISDLEAIGLHPPDSSAADTGALLAADAAAPDLSTGRRGGGGGLPGAGLRSLPGLSRSAALALAARQAHEAELLQAADSWFAAQDRLMSGRPVALEASGGEATAVTEDEASGAAAMLQARGRARRGGPAAPSRGSQRGGARGARSGGGGRTQDGMDRIG
jgi:hypothetical protein